MLTWIQGYCNRDSPGGCGEGGKWGMGDRVEDEGIFWGGESRMSGGGIKDTDMLKL